MVKPELYDVVELIIDLPQIGLKLGQLGTIVEIHNDNAYEVDFSTSDGESLEFLALKPEQFIVVWQYTNHAWVPLADRIHAMLEILPEDQQKQVLDFTRSQVLDCTRSLHRVPA